ncbi:MAG: hypothetical protein V1664_00855 [Candidatus Uhrbacteria bacterium]
MKKYLIIIGLFLAVVVGIYFLYQPVNPVKIFLVAINLPICSEKGFEYPVINKQYTNFSINSLTTKESLCDAVISLETSDSERTVCNFEKIASDETDSLGFLTVYRANTCRLSGDSEPYKTYFYGLTAKDAIYHLVDVGYFSNRPEVETDFLDLSLSEYKKVATYISDHDLPPEASFYLGQYLYFWGKKNNISCFEMNLPDDINSHCFLSAADDLYPDYNLYQPSAEWLLNKFGSCRDILSFKIPHEPFHYSRAILACAVTTAALQDDPFYCLDKSFSGHEGEFAGLYTCVQKLTTPITEQYCLNLKDQDAEQKEIHDWTVSNCYRVFAWQTGEENYCNFVARNFNTDEYFQNKCRDEVTRLKQGDLPVLVE